MRQRNDTGNDTGKEVASQRGERRMPLTYDDIRSPFVSHGICFAFVIIGGRIDRDRVYAWYPIGDIRTLLAPSLQAYAASLCRGVTQRTVVAVTPGGVPPRSACRGYRATQHGLIRQTGPSNRTTWYSRYEFRCNV